MMAPSPTPIAMEVLVPSVISCTPTTALNNLHNNEPLDLRYTDSHSIMMESTTSIMMEHDDDDCDMADYKYSYRIQTATACPMPPQPTTPTEQQHRNTQTVRVNVGGEAFSFPHSAFGKFLGLPWKRNRSGVYCLEHSSAAVFEVLLDYTLFGTYPAYDTMSAEEFQEFETMALAMGGLTTLIEHFDRKDSYLVKELRQSRPRRSSGHYLLNPANSPSSPNSICATRRARFLGALCALAETITRRRPQSSGESVGSHPSADPKQRLEKRPSSD